MWNISPKCPLNGNGTCLSTDAMHFPVDAMVMSLKNWNMSFEIAMSLGNQESSEYLVGITLIELGDVSDRDVYSNDKISLK